MEDFTIAEIRKVADMIKRAEKKGLLLVVVHDALDKLDTDSDSDVGISEAINYSLEKWNC